MAKLVIDYVVPDLSPAPGIPQLKAGMPPLNIALLKAQTPVEVDGVTVEARCHHERTMGPYDAAQRHPDVVAVSVITQSANRAYALLDACRATTSHQGRRVRTWAGGPHVTALPVEACAHADAVVRGGASPRLLERLVRWTVRQLDADGDGRVVVEEFPDLGKEEGGGDGQAGMPVLPAQPIPDFTWCDPSRYLMGGALQTSVGCPFDCSFCSCTATYGARQRRLDYGDIAAAIRLLPRKGLTGIIDDNLLPGDDLTHLRAVCDLLREAGVPWVAEMTALTAHRQWQEVIPLLRRSGCRLLLFGFESLDGGLGKSAPAADYADLVRCVQDCGMGVIGFFMFGTNDEEGPDVFARTAQWATDMHLDFANFAVNTPLPGARDFERAVRESTITDWNWDHYDTWYPVRRFAHISPEAMYAGVREAFRTFYGAGGIAKRVAGRFKRLFVANEVACPLTRFKSISLGAALGMHLGSNRFMRWRLGQPYADFDAARTREANPAVLAQYGPDRPLCQADTGQRAQEVAGRIAPRTPAIVGGAAPVAVYDAGGVCIAGSPLS